MSSNRAIVLAETPALLATDLILLVSLEVQLAYKTTLKLGAYMIEENCAF